MVLQTALSNLGQDFAFTQTGECLPGDFEGERQ